MCGIAGILNLDGAPVMPRCWPHDRRDRAPRAGRRGRLRRRAGRARPPAPGDHRPVAGRPPADGRRATARYVLTYNGEIYNFRELRAELEARGHRFRSRTRHRGRAPRLRASGAPTRVERFNGMFAFAIWDARAARAAARARPLRHQAALLRRDRATRSLFGSEIKAISRIPALPRRARPRRRCSSTSRSRTSSPTARCSTASGCCRRAATLTRRPRDGRARSRRATGTSTSASRTAAASDEEYVEELDRLLPPGRHAPAGQRRAVGSYLSAAAWIPARSRRSPRASSRTCTPSRGFDLSSASGLELGFDEREHGRAHVLPVQDRALRDGAQGRRHGARACRSSSGTSRTRASARATRTSTPRSSPASSSRSCCRRRRRRAVRRLPWRYYRAVVNDDFDALRRQVLRLLAAADAEQRRCQRVLRADLERRRGTSHARHLPRRVRRRTPRARAPEDYVNHSLYFEAKTFLHGLLVVEDKLSDGARPRDAGAVPRQRSRRLRACGCRSASSSATSSEVVRLDENEPGPKTRALLRADPRRQAAPARA